MKKRFVKGGIFPNHRPISSLLPGILDKISHKKDKGVDRVFSFWNQLLGNHSVKAIPQSLDGGILRVKVKSSNLYNLIRQDKPKLLYALQEKFPQLAISDIVFRIG